MQGNLKSGWNAECIASKIENTLLRPEATEKDFEHLCQQALEFNFYGVCVPPNRVGFASNLLEGTCVKVVTVAGFPFGYQAPAVKVFEIENAFLEGADEVDAVIDIGALKDGRLSDVEKEVHRLVEVARSVERIKKPRAVKIIIETCYLSDEEKVKAARLILDAGADFVKTSTGFGPIGATVEDVALLHKATGGRLKIKAAGGIRTMEQAKALLMSGASRLGTSCGPDLMK